MEEKHVPQAPVANSSHANANANSNQQEVPVQPEQQQQDVRQQQQDPQQQQQQAVQQHKQCYFCAETFQTLWKLLRHMEEKHVTPPANGFQREVDNRNPATIPRVYPCGHCPFSCRDRAILIRHHGQYHPQIGFGNQPEHVLPWTDDQGRVDQRLKNVYIRHSHEIRMQGIQSAVSYLYTNNTALSNKLCYHNYYYYYYYYYYY